MSMTRIHRVLFAAALSATALSPLAVAAGAGATATPTQYVVQRGDFLAGIAAKVGVKLPDLLTANSLTAQSLILPGQTLVVPAGGTAPVPAAAPAAGIVYTVKSGDYLMGIATAYKVKLSDLLVVNNMTAKSVIKPGSQITLPVNAVAPVPAVAPAPAAAPAPAVAPAPSGITYTVKSGDYLARIASSYKVKLADLLATNSMQANSLITPGLVLTMPAGAVVPTIVVASAVVAAPPAAAAGPTGSVVAYAYAQLGKPYRFFTAGPDTFDCSGLTMMAYTQVGINLVHNSTAQANSGTAVDLATQDIKAGDLIFMSHAGGPISHVGIAVDATHWIHAPKPGDVVRLAPIPAKASLTSVRRLTP
jgi:cell wall-associated NlpC family hydrolase